MSIAFLFPGLGAERPGMLHRLPDTAASATVLAEADIALRSGAARLPAPWGAGPARGGDEDGEVAGGIAELDSPQALTESPVARQLALLVAGVAAARALCEDEGVRPGLVAGVGPGGYAAAVTAGVLTFEEALRAVRLCGELVRRAEEPAETVAVRLAQHLATVPRRPLLVPYASGLHGRTLSGGPDRAGADGPAGRGSGWEAANYEVNRVFDDLARSVSPAGPANGVAGEDAYRGGRGGDNRHEWPDLAAVVATSGVTRGLELPPGRSLSEQPAMWGAVRVRSVEECGIAMAAEWARGGAGHLPVEEMGQEPFPAGAPAPPPQSGFA